MKLAEWATIDIIRRPTEAVAHGQVTCFDMLNYFCPVFGFTPTETTFSKNRLMPTNHWSRAIEYPWALTNADLHGTETCLDVGGGNNPFQFALAFNAKAVWNVDTDEIKLYLAAKLPVMGLFKNIFLAHQDALTLGPPQCQPFDRVFCISVLEHMPDPIKALRHLYDVLTAPGGRLIVTFDVCDYPCEDFPIGIEGAEALLKEMGFTMPDPKDAFMHPAIKVEGKYRPLRVMMLYIDKE